MKEELELTLFVEHSKLLKDYKGDPKYTPMAWGMQCGDGWYDILSDYFRQLDKMSELCDSLTVTINTIKEKFGALRVYTNMECDDNVVSSIIHCLSEALEEKSKSVCEITGKYGTLCRDGSWYKTLSYEAVRNEYNSYIPISNSIADYWNELDKKENL